MINILQPPIWLLVLIAGLPQLSETIYTPSLPAIAHALQACESTVEHTLTIYLLGFAVGTFFWGKVSDKFGRRPCVLAGLLIFLLGCIGCYFSTTIQMLMVSRFIQAFGGSIGSVLGQTICRDAFHGPESAKVYSFIGSALAIFPALGPICGGVISQHFGWIKIFLFLAAFSIILVGLVARFLPETHPESRRGNVSFAEVALRLLRDKKVLGFSLIVGGCNGILFSYFAEGPFYFIKALGLSPSQYGASFLMIAAATMMGGVYSHRLHKQYSSPKIMRHGLVIMAFGALVFSVISLAHHSIAPLPLYSAISLALLSQMILSFGICMVTSNALALALLDYKDTLGTASSLFGLLYYSLISLFTFLMGLLHNGSLIPMPLYFLGLSLMMIIVQKMMLNPSPYEELKKEASQPS